MTKTELELLDNELDEYMIETRRIKTECLNQDMKHFLLLEKIKSSYIYECLDCGDYIPKATMTESLHSC